MQARADDVRSVAAGFERGVRAQAEDALDALRAAEARRTAVLASQSEELRRSLDALERCVEAAASACASSSDDPLPFLHRFRELSDACQRLVGKPVDEGIDVSVEEFERDAEAAASGPWDRDKEILHKLLAVKDQMIWCG